MARRFKILSLDGGGSWALIQVRALMSIYGEDAQGHEVLDDFDLAVANSGGSIVLGALLKGFSLKRIFDLFGDPQYRNHIFEPENFLERAINKLIGIGPRYKTPGKLAGLRRIYEMEDGVFGRDFADWYLYQVSDAINARRAENGRGVFNFMIVAFDRDREQAIFLRSNTNSRAGSFRRIGQTSLVESVHASTNVPINYFDRPAEIYIRDIGMRNFWDGAIGGYNNPILAGVVEAMAQDDRRRRQIAVLSIGTGTLRLPTVDERTVKAGYLRRREHPRGLDMARLKGDIHKLARGIIADPPDAASMIAHVMLGERLPRGPDDRIEDTRIVRMNPMIVPKFVGERGETDIGIDDWGPYDWFSLNPRRGRTLFERLRDTDIDAVKQSEVEDIKRLAGLWLDDQVPNQAIRANRFFDAEIGHDRFTAARDRWLSLRGTDSKGNPVDDSH